MKCNPSSIFGDEGCIDVSAWVVFDDAVECHLSAAAAMLECARRQALAWFRQFIHPHSTEPQVFGGSKDSNSTEMAEIWVVHFCRSIQAMFM